MAKRASHVDHTGAGDLADRDAKRVKEDITPHTELLASRIREHFADIGAFISDDDITSVSAFLANRGAAHATSQQQQATVNALISSGDYLSADPQIIYDKVSTPSAQQAKGAVYYMRYIWFQRSDARPLIERLKEKASDSAIRIIVQLEHLLRDPNWAQFHLPYSGISGEEGHSTLHDRNMLDIFAAEAAQTATGKKGPPVTPASLIAVILGGVTKQNSGIISSYSSPFNSNGGYPGYVRGSTIMTRIAVATIDEVRAAGLEHIFEDVLMAALGVGKLNSIPSPYAMPLLSPTIAASVELATASVTEMPNIMLVGNLPPDATTKNTISLFNRLFDSFLPARLAGYHPHYISAHAGHDIGMTFTDAELEALRLSIRDVLPDTVILSGIAARYAWLQAINVRSSPGYTPNRQTLLNTSGWVHCWAVDGRWIKVTAVTAPQTACSGMGKHSLSQLQLAAAVVIAAQDVSSMQQLKELYPAFASDLPEYARAKDTKDSTSEGAVAFINTLKLPTSGFPDPKQALLLYKTKDQYWLRRDVRINDLRGAISFHGPWLAGDGNASSTIVQVHFDRTTFEIKFRGVDGVDLHMSLPLSRSCKSLFDTNRPAPGEQTYLERLIRLEYERDGLDITPFETALTQSWYGGKKSTEIFIIDRLDQREDRLTDNFVPLVIPRKTMSNFSVKFRKQDGTLFDGDATRLSVNYGRLGFLSAGSYAAVYKKGSDPKVVFLKVAQDPETGLWRFVPGALQRVDNSNGTSWSLFPHGKIQHGVRKEMLTLRSAILDQGLDRAQDLPLPGEKGSRRTGKVKTKDREVIEISD